MIVQQPFTQLGFVFLLAEKSWNTETTQSVIGNFTRNTKFANASLTFISQIGQFKFVIIFEFLFLICFPLTSHKILNTENTHNVIFAIADIKLKF